MSTATELLHNVPDSSLSSEESLSIGPLRSTFNAIANLAPIHDWVSFAILVWMMVNVGWSVQLAGWGDLPSVIPTLLMGTMASFVVTKLKFPWYLTIVYALGLGFFVVMWQGTLQATGGDPINRAIDGYSRYLQWIETAQSGGISTDPVPFALMFIAASWIVGYVVPALTFRFRSPWLPTVLLSLVILTNLSYRHGQHEHTFFLFLVGGIALFAHLTTVRRIERWKAEGIEYSKHLAWATVQDGVILALPIVLIGALLPVWEPRSDRIHQAWDVFRAPFYALQDPANRLLAGVDGPGSDDLFGSPSPTMAFGGPITLTEEPLMWVRAKYVSPYAGRVYQRYSSEGWLTDPSTKVNAPPRTALTVPPTELERERVSNVYVPLVDTKTVVPSGEVFSTDRETVVQVLDPLVWNVPLTGSVARISELPPDLRDISFAIRFALNDLVPVSLFTETPLNNQLLTTPELVNQVIERLQTADESGERQVITRSEVNANGVEEKFETNLFKLSDDSDMIDWNELTIEPTVDSGTGLASSLRIERSTPIEQVGVELASQISKDDTFSVQTFVSLATDEQLDDAGTDYPTWITDRYLQLPGSLPDEVGVLATKIIRDAGAVTPFEKAEAVKEFLKDQEYSLEIDGPEFGTDGIYYFLFETAAEPCASVDENCDTSKIKGYSQYFGSSGAVLLRSVGVPARFVAGWGAGEYVPEAGLFLIRDKDRHGWTQVYFPDYGWIDYEMTPGRDSLERGSFAPTVGGGDVFSAGAVGSGEENPDFIQDIADLERLAQEAREAQRANADNSSESDSDQFVLPWRPLAWSAGVVGFAVVLTFAWWLSLRSMDAPTRAYARMNRLAALLGMKRHPNQTALEFADDLGGRTFAASEHAMFIAIEYQRRVYANASGRSDIDKEASKNLDRAWRRVARSLIAYRIRQVGGLGPELGEGRNA